jgi:hypothetical protein
MGIRRALKITDERKAAYDSENLEVAQFGFHRGS